MKTITDWILLLVVAVLGAGIYVLFHDQIDSAILVILILVIGFSIGLLSKKIPTRNKKQD